MVPARCSQPDPRRLEASNRLRKKSLIAWVVERIFYKLNCLSPASAFKSSKTTDYYILSILGVGLALGFISYRFFWPRTPVIFGLLLCIIAILRIVDIIQNAANVSIFGQLGTEYPEVEDITRSLVLLVLNYVELIGWFGLIYLVCELKNVSSFYDPFYFSVMTQLTVGYGDIKPIRIAKAVAGVQATLGWAMTVLILARFISSLPIIRDRHNDRGSSDSCNKKETSDSATAVEKIPAKKENLKIKIDYLKTRLDHTLTHLQTASKMIYLIDGGVLAFGYFLVSKFGLSRNMALFLAPISWILAGINFLHSRFILTQQHWYREIDRRIRDLLDQSDLPSFTEQFPRSWFPSSHRILKHIHVWIVLWLFLISIFLLLYGFGLIPEINTLTHNFQV